MSIQAASRSLCETSPEMAELVAVHGPPVFGRQPRVDERFEGLARSIADQQLAGAAATTIWGRATAVLDGQVTPRSILNADSADLRAAGLSGAKTASLTDLALKVDDGTVVLERLGRRDDAAVISELTVVRGIGLWIAHMFLIFSLRRLDVWPTGDLGVRNGYARAYGLSEAPSAKELDPLGEPFRPHRAVPAWYFWRAADSPA